MKLDTVANVATVITCVVICTVLIARRSPSSVPGSPAVNPYKTGEAMDSIKEVDYRAAPRTLLIFVRSTCHFCTESMPFYRTLAESRTHESGAVRLVVVSSDPADVAARYIGQYAVKVDHVTTVEARATRLSATPSLVLVDHNGKVVKQWTGELSKDREQEVLKALGASS